MSFSFNWSGLNVGQITPKDNQNEVINLSSKMGNALNTYGINKAIEQSNNEYANLINASYSNNLNSVSDIEQKIKNLEQRNEQIKLLIQKAETENTQTNSLINEPINVDDLKFNWG